MNPVCFIKSLVLILVNRLTDLSIYKITNSHDFDKLFTADKLVYPIYLP